MGLDQYLHATLYTSKAEWRGEEINKLYSDIINLTNASKFAIKSDYASASVEVMVAQWRKANAIHQWFVDNCQNGEDDCRKTYVSRDDLQKLIALCKEVIEDKDKADDLLPTASGFFFGSTDYDEYYFGDLVYTVETLEALLNETPDNWDFQYSSSW